jgi:hypothetical protein
MSRERIDYFSGKPIPSIWPKETREKCDECGTNLIDRCMRCGAPVCCPKCCAEIKGG